MQHTRDLDGEPDALGWCDVSTMSKRPDRPHDAVGKDNSVPVLVDHVEGDLDIGYRRHTADWLRGLPIDDEVEMRACDARRGRHLAFSDARPWSPEQITHRVRPSSAPASLWAQGA